MSDFRITLLCINECSYVNGTTQAWTKDVRSEIKLSIELEKASEQLGSGHRVVVLH